MHTICARGTGDRGEVGQHRIAHVLDGCSHDCPVCVLSGYDGLGGLPLHMGIDGQILTARKGIGLV